MNEQLHALVEHTMAQGVGARVFALRWQNRRIWIKQAVAPKQKGWHRLQRFFATVTGLAMLRPTVSPGGKAGLASEANILRKLSGKGILVPDLVEETEDWIAIGDNGAILQTRIEEHLRQGDTDAIEGLITSGAQGLAGLHRAGVAHGAPLLRNLTIRDDGQIGFIDFEEDPNARMPIVDAQARDVLLFIFSIQRGFKKRPELLRSGWNAYVTAVGFDASQLKPLRKVVGVLLPVYLILRPFRRWLGTDALNGLLAYRTLRQTLKHDTRR